jgi:hypothetical protein
MASTIKFIAQILNLGLLLGIGLSGFAPITYNGAIEAIFATLALNVLSIALNKTEKI